MSYKLDSKFHDNMTLPADVPAKIYGEADYPVTVSVDMHSAVCFAFDGKFALEIPAHKAGGPYTMFIESEGKVTKIHNVYFGEVLDVQ
jgi:sialate O-acetylesterase